MKINHFYQQQNIGKEFVHLTWDGKDTLTVILFK